MMVVVDLSTGAVSMRDAEDLKRFAVTAVPVEPGDGEANGALGAMAAALSVNDVGTVEPSGDALVTVGAVRRLAAQSAAVSGTTLDNRWESDLADMLASAASKGWIADDGSIRAHIEWGS